MHPLRIQYIQLLKTKNGRDLRFQRCLRLLVAKGYISISVPIVKSYQGHLSIHDLLWVCENIEPRLYQLVPTLILRFPGHFIPSDSELPSDLQAILLAFKRDLEEGPFFKGFSFSLLKKWLEFKPRDLRSKGVQGRRLSLRLNSEAAKVLDEYCEAQQISLTDGIHRAVSRLGNPVKNRI